MQTGQAFKNEYRGLGSVESVNVSTERDEGTVNECAIDTRTS